MPADSARSTVDSRSWGTPEIVAIGALVGLLFMPLPGKFAAPWVGALQDLAHVPLFFVVAWLLRRFTGSAGAAAVLALGLAIVVEPLQSLVGRSSTLDDVVRGALGVAAFVGWHLASGISASLPRIFVRVAAIAASAAWPLAIAWPTVVDALAAWREFPVLAEFSSPRETRRWVAEGCRLTFGRDDAGAGVGVMDCRPTGGASSSIFLFPVLRDWSRFGSLRIELTVDGEPMPITVSVRDGRRVAPLRRRFDQRAVYQAGRHVVRIDLGEVSRGSEAVAPIDVSRVQSFHVIVEPGDQPRVLTIHRVWLE